MRPTNILLSHTDILLSHTNILLSHTDILLSQTTNIPLVASRLVDKFGLDAFNKLWPVFAGNRDAYVAAVKAFRTWHRRRMQVLICLCICTHTHTHTHTQHNTTHIHTHVHVCMYLLFVCVYACVCVCVCGVIYRHLTQDPRRSLWAIARHCH